MILTNLIKNTSGFSEVDFDNAFFDILHPDNGAVTPESASRLGSVAAAHRILTNSIAAMPWMIRQKVGDARTEPEHNLSTVLKYRTNAYMSPFLYMKTLISWAFWHGTGYAYISRDKKGRIDELIPLPCIPDIRINPDDGVKWYKFTLPSDNPYGTRLSKSFTESQLIIYRFETFDGQFGRGFLDLAGKTVDADLKSQSYADKFYSNGARPSGVIEVEGDLNKENRDMLRDQFQAEYSGDNAFRVAVLDLGMKYTQMGISQQDSQYIESRQFTVDEVSRFTGIPAYMLQTGKQSYQSNEQQQLDFIVNTLTPPIVQLEQEHQYKLYTTDEWRAGWYLKLNEASLLRGSHAERAQYYQKMVGMAVYSPDDVRNKEDLSPLPNGAGKKYWMSKNYAPVDNLEAFGTGSSNNKQGGDNDEN